MQSQYHALHQSASRGKKLTFLSREDINKIATNLPMSVQDAAIESVSVRKSL